MAIRNVTRAGVGLVVGIIILGLLVFGGLWLVNQRGEQARREEAITIADQQLQSESNEEVAIDTSNGTNAPEAESETNPTAPQPNNGAAAAPAPAAAHELPQTGPEASVVMIGVLAFAVASFVHSRKLVS
jgi:FtsZ-interacting cell division protein ZipA